MKTYFSADAGRIVQIEGEELIGCEADRPAAAFTMSLAALPHVFSDAPDVEEAADFEDATKRLLVAWNKNRSLRMLDILMDVEEDVDTRQEAAALLTHLLTSSETNDWFQNTIFSTNSDITLDESTMRLLHRWQQLRDVIMEVHKSQAKIRELRTRWVNLSDKLFEDAAQKSSLEQVLAFEGYLKKLVLAPPGAAMNTVIMECFLRFQKINNGRAIVGEFTKGLSEKRIPFKTIKDELPVDEEQPTPNALSSKGIYQSVVRQQDGVLEQLQKGDVALARRFARDLVDFQLNRGDHLFAAKSLCLLSQKAKSLGNTVLQLEWVVRATEIAPSDSWTHGQAGDAYLSLYRFEEAWRCFERAAANGDEHFGRTGQARILRASGRLDPALRAYEAAIRDFPNHPEAHRAWAGYSEVLRDMWKLEASLESYTDAVNRFPNESVLRCGQAAVLADLGRLADARAAYAAAKRNFPESVVAYSGYADVLKQMGALDDALEAYQQAIEYFPHEVVPICGKADVLRAGGQIQPALDTYKKAQRNFAHDPTPYAGVAELLKESGEFQEALAAYDSAISQFPFEVRCRNGRANLLKEMHRYEDALAAFDKNAHDFPYDLYSLSGRANLLKLLGKMDDAVNAYDAIISKRPDYPSAKVSKASIFVCLGKLEEAEKLLPNNFPQTEQDWISFHVRGMIEVKAGNVHRAMDIFKFGLAFTPFYKERAYFETALAAAKLRSELYEEAISIPREIQSTASNIIYLHAYGALGKFKEARDCLAKITNESPSNVIHLRDEIAARFGLIDRAPLRDENWILDQEVNVLLQQAA